MPPLALMRLAMASMSSVVQISDREAEALDTVPSLAAVILIQVDAHIARFERDKDKPALPLVRALHAEAHDVLVPVGALLNVFHGD